MGSDKMISRHVNYKPLTIRFPDRREWKVGFQPNRKGGLIWYTDGSKTYKALELGCIAMVQDGNLVLALGNIQQYSRQNPYAITNVTASVSKDELHKYHTTGLHTAMHA
jgi:hypothetical protein